MNHASRLLRTSISSVSSQISSRSLFRNSNLVNLSRYHVGALSTTSQGRLSSPLNINTRSSNMFRHDSKNSYPLSLSKRTYFSINDLLFGEEKEPEQSFTKDGLPRSYKVNGKYVCQWSKDITAKKDFFMSLQWLMRGGNPAFVENLEDHLTDVNVERGRDDFLRTCAVNMEKLRGSPESGNNITWFGHSSCLFKLNGKFILTDPVWYDRCSPVSFYGPKRVVSPAIDVDKIPIDIVLLSHTHYDHFDEETIAKIGNRALWIVPLGCKNLLNRLNVTNCIELDWWEDVVVPKSGKVTHKSGNSEISSTAVYSSNEGGDDVRIVFTPTKHWTSRNPFDKNTCLWGSFAMLSSSGNAFFTGDTAYCDVFKKIGELYGPFDVAAIPIGAYKPRFYMKHIHCNPKEALMIHRDLRSKSSLGIHWGLWALSEEDMIEPPLEMARERETLNINREEFFTMINGETHVFGEQPTLQLESSQKEIFASYKRYVKSSDFVAEDEYEKLGLVGKVKENITLHRSKLSQRATMYAMNYKGKKSQKNKNKNFIKVSNFFHRSLVRQKFMKSQSETQQKFKAAASNLRTTASNVRAVGKAAASSAFNSHSYFK